MAQKMITADIRHAYKITFADYPTLVFENQERWQAARVIKFARRDGLAITITHVAQYSEYSGEACYGCRARMALWDHDCDGPYCTSVCGSPQCDWWSAVGIRDKHKQRRKQR